MPLVAGVLLAVSAFLPWVIVGNVVMTGVPDVAALWVAGLGALAAVLAALSLITREFRHPLLIIGLFALGITFLSWRIMPRAAGERAKTLAQAFAIVDDAPVIAAPPASSASASISGSPHPCPRGFRHDHRGQARLHGLCRRPGRRRRLTRRYRGVREDRRDVPSSIQEQRVVCGWDNSVGGGFCEQQFHGPAAFRAQIDRVLVHVQVDVPVHHVLAHFLRVRADVAAGWRRDARTRTPRCGAGRDSPRCFTLVRQRALDDDAAERNRRAGLALPELAEVDDLLQPLRLVGEAVLVDDEPGVELVRRAAPARSPRTPAASCRCAFGNARPSRKFAVV